MMQFQNSKLMFSQVCNQKNQKPKSESNISNIHLHWMDWACGETSDSENIQKFNLNVCLK